MDKDFLEKIKNSAVWEKEFSDIEDVLDNGILKCKEIPPFIKVIQNIIRTSDIVKLNSEKYLAKFDLSIPQKNILDALYYSKKKYLTQCELSKFVYTSKANISTIIDRMEHKKLIKREENKLNKREKKVIITKQGEELIYLSMQEISSCDFLNFLPEDDCIKLNNYLNKIRNEFKNMKI